MGPELFPLESIYPYHPGHRFEMRLAFQDAKVMNTVVAIASFRYALENKAQFFVDAGLRHQGQALRLVKESLTNGDPICDAGTVLCIAQLACLEVSCVCDLLFLCLLTSIAFLRGRGRMANSYRRSENSL